MQKDTSFLFSQTLFFLGFDFLVLILFFFSSSIWGRGKPVFKSWKGLKTGFQISPSFFFVFFLIHDSSHLLRDDYHLWWLIRNLLVHPVSCLLEWAMNDLSLLLFASWDLFMLCAQMLTFYFIHGHVLILKKFCFLYFSGDGTQTKVFKDK